MIASPARNAAATPSSQGTLNVLFSSAGRRVELLECFRSAGRQLKLPLRIFASDMDPRLSAACHVADQSFAVPPCSEEAFIPALIEICQSEAIGLLIPTIDPELEPIARNASRFSAVGTKALISTLETVLMARDKLATHAFFTKIGVPAPKTVLLSEFPSAGSHWEWPLLVKPRAGSASKNVHVFRNPGELHAAALETGSYIVQEFQRGREYTVNLFFDSERLGCAIPHWRIETRGGEVSKGMTQRVPSLESISDRMGRALAGQALGPLCFQAIVNDAGAASAIELNARFGGGYPLAHHAGANFALWLLEMAQSSACSMHDGWTENTRMLRYDTAVYDDGQSALPAR